MQPIDWNATAAWIALAISITGTIVGPIVTTILTNRHQLKLRKMDILQRTIEKYEDNRFRDIQAFISRIGKYLAQHDMESRKSFGECFYNIYQYVPASLWDKLDFLYVSLCAKDYDSAHKIYSSVVRELALILKETPR